MLAEQSPRFLLFFLFFLLACCGGNGDFSSKKTYSPLLPMRQEQFLPSLDSGDVRAAMRAYFAQIKAPAFSQYDFVRRDLNGDYLKEALVYVNTPYGRWCTAQGCRLIILRAHMDGFSLIGSFESVRPPFYVSKKSFNGWHDIAIEMNGQFYKKAETCILRFEGNGYKRSLAQPYVFSQELIEASLLP